MTSMKISRRLALLTFCILLSSSSSFNEAGGKEKWARNLPTERDYRSSLLKIMKSYSTNGKHRYYWPRGSGWKGTTCDLVYQGVTIAKGDPKGRCFCCGLTFEVFFRAYEACLKKNKKDFKIGDLDATAVRRLLSKWFGKKGDRRLLQDAITQNGLGRAINKPEKARAGDFVQFWRHSKSGHSVVFVSWERDRGGKITGIRYWSTQKSTRGIGQRTEKIGPKGVKRDEIYIARVGKS
jgi:hypothetical protein